MALSIASLTPIKPCTQGKLAFRDPHRCNVYLFVWPSLQQAKWQNRRQVPGFLFGWKACAARLILYAISSLVGASEPYGKFESSCNGSSHVSSLYEESRQGPGTLVLSWEPPDKAPWAICPIFPAATSENEQPESLCPCSFIQVSSWGPTPKPKMQLPELSILKALNREIILTCKFGFNASNLKLTLSPSFHAGSLRSPGTLRTCKGLKQNPKVL